MASNPILRARLERVGMGCIPPAAGLAALDAALHQFTSTGKQSIID